MPNADYISAISALAGTFIGGFTSIASSWLGQKHQSKMETYLRKKSERQSLYKQFIQEASSLYIDSLEHEETGIPKFVSIYATINIMRILSSDRVIAEAEKVLQAIIETYPKKSKSFQELVTMDIDKDFFDPLRSFSDACREELG